MEKVLITRANVDPWTQKVSTHTSEIIKDCIDSVEVIDLAVMQTINQLSSEKPDVEKLKLWREIVASELNKIIVYLDGETT